MSRQIHIQHVVLSLEPGGLENGVVNIVNRLDPMEFRSSICCLRRIGAFAARIRGGNVAIQDMGSRGGSDFLLPWQLAMHFRRTRTDIIHTRNPEAFFYGFLGAKLGGVPRIVHSEHGRVFNERKIRYWAQRIMSGYIDALFSVTNRLKQDLVSHVGIPTERIGVIYNGIDLNRSSGTNRHQARAALELGIDDLVVGSVGRLVPVKNFMLLLRAMHSISVPNAILLLIGDGPERGELEREAARLGMSKRVRMLGHREDVLDLLSVMDVFVLPSVSEGLSNTLLEAMAAGIAVVASNVGGNSEIIRDEIDGFLFQSRDQIGLCNRLVPLLNNRALRTQFGSAGHERVSQNFSMQAMVRKYEELYRTVFADHGNRS